jgi:hypothetical protein
VVSGVEEERMSGLKMVEEKLRLERRPRRRRRLWGLILAADLWKLRNRKALMEAGMRKSRARARLHGARRLHVMEEGR